MGAESVGKALMVVRTRLEEERAGAEAERKAKTA